MGKNLPGLHTAELSPTESDRFMHYALMLSSQIPPEETIGVARLAESAGFNRIWLTEDYYRKAAFASCGAVLGATSSLTVCLGVTSLYLRHPTTLAMEVATLHRMFGSRFEVGLGLGSPRALNGSKRMPDKVIASPRERLALMADLLAGNEVSWSDELDAVGGARLQYPANTDAPTWLAAEGPQMLALAREHADGVVFSAFSTPAYLDWAMPILNKNEINTKIIIQRLFSETDCTVITSKSDFNTLEMKHYIINDQTQFQGDNYGIPTPINAEEINSFEIDWIIVPLICFDSKGFRVGYGKGFYDRFIVRCRSDIKIIGLSIFNPIEKISDKNEFDKPLDYCITPNNVYHFKQ